MRKLSIALLIASVALLLIGAASTTTSFFKNISASGNVAGTNWSATGTAADRMPVGTTAQQPSALDGMIRYNSTTARFEHGTGGSWKNFVRLDGDTMTGALTVNLSSLAAITAPAMTLSNSTASTAGVPLQYSPSLYMSGSAWLTGSLSNAPVIFRSYIIPVGGTTVPAASYRIESSMNGGSFGNIFDMTSSGTITLSGAATLQGPLLIQASSGGYFGWAGQSLMHSAANGAVEFVNNAANARATLQANIPQVTKTANYTIVALDSGLRFVNIGAGATNRLDLPTAAATQHYYFYVDAAFNMQVQATGTDVIREGATASAAAGDIHSSTVGSSLHVFSPKAGLWVVDQKDGVWVGPQ